MQEPFIREVVVGFLKPLTDRSPFTTSRIAILANKTTIPILRLLALRKFGVWAPDLFPCWADGNPENETLQNVELVKRVPTTRRKLNISSPDYRKEWRSQNPDRVRRYSRAARLRRLQRAELELELEEKRKPE